MNPTMTFDAALTVVEQLPPDDQAELIALIQRRLALQGRQRVVAEVKQGRIDYQNGLATKVDLENLLDDLPQ
jgi:hypothetical protein